MVFRCASRRKVTVTVWSLHVRMVLASAVCAIFLLLSLAVLVPDCAEAETISTLRIGMVEPIDSINPFMGVNDNSYVFYGLVYDYLVAVDENLEPKPNLARSWCVVQDHEPVGSVWQYNLTRNAMWHDGRPFTADDVVFTVQYQIGDNWLSMWAYQPYTVLISSVEAIDEYTVRIHFSDFDGNPAACSFGHSLMMPIVPKHIWRDIPVSTAGFSYVNEKPIGTGPFMCTDDTYEEFLRGDRLILLKNPNYHGAVDYGKAIQFDRLILEFYLEPAAMVVDMQRGAIDVAAFDAPNFKNLVDWITRNSVTDITTHSGLKCTAYSVEIGICMNPDSGAGTNPLRMDPAVRKAMAHATDKEFIRDYIYMGYGEIGSALLSPIYPYWYWEPEPGEEYEFDLELANELLDEAGYVWNDDHTVRVSSPDNPLYPLGGLPLEFGLVVEEEIFEDKATAKFLVTEWAKIGIKLEPMYVDSALWGVLVYAGKFDLTLTYWSGDPDPNYLLYVQSTRSVNGWSENWYSSPEYDENYTMSLLTVDPELRREYVVNCQKHTYYDAAFIVTLYPYGCYAWRTDHFTGWGDWAAHPGRSLANFWSANDLFFDLVPTSQSEEGPMCIMDTLAGPLGEDLEVTGFAWNPSGKDMSYNIEFGDGATASGTVASGADISVTHAYSANGTYTMNLSVSLGSDVAISSSLATIVPAGGNSPPTNLRILPTPMTGSPGTNASFAVSGKDREGDPVTLRLDFEDESAPYQTTVTDTSDGFEVLVDHAYDTLGNWELTLVANDTHNETRTSLVFLVAEPAEDDDDTLLVMGVVAGALVVAAAVAYAFLRRRRGGREEDDVKLP